MSALITLLKEGIAKREKRIAEIDEILNANPLGDLIRLRREAQKELEEVREKGEEHSDEWLNRVRELANTERELFELSEKQIDNGSELIREKCDLESELRTLQSELYLKQQLKDQ